MFLFAQTNSFLCKYKALALNKCEKVVPYGMDVNDLQCKYIMFKELIDSGTKGILYSNQIYMFCTDLYE